MFFGGECLVEDRKKGKMTVGEAGRMGGLKTSETHGPEFYSEMVVKAVKKFESLLRTEKGVKRTKIFSFFF